MMGFRGGAPRLDCPPPLTLSSLPSTMHQEMLTPPTCEAEKRMRKVPGCESASIICASSLLT